MVGDAGCLNQGDEIARGKLRQSGFAEMRVAAEKIFRLDGEVCKIAAPAAGNEDLAARLSPMFQQQHTLAARGCGAGAKQAGSARADHDNIKFLVHAGF